MIIDIYTLEKKEVGMLLLITTHFNIHFNQTRAYNKVFTTLSTLVTPKYDKEVWCLITNIGRAMSDKASALSIPKNKEVYKDNDQCISYTRLFTLLDTLVDNEYLTYYRGGFIGNIEDRIQSIYKFTPKMLSLWEDVRLQKQKCVEDSIVIRDRATKNTLSNSGVCGVRTLSEDVEKFNSVIKSIDIAKDGVVLCNQSYFRSFLDNLHTGGRWYNRTGAIQGMSQLERKKLTMNNERVVELDFKAMHPSILYERVWQQDKEYVENWIMKFMGGRFDPYFVDVSSFIQVDTALISEYMYQHNLEKYQPIRNLIKFAVMSGLNAGSENSAGGAITKEIYSEKNKWEDWENDPEFKYYGLVIPEDYRGVKTLKTSFLCQAVRMSNGPIEKYFFSDVGVELQYTDSQIISQVINSLAVDGEVGLSMHDSIIVRESLAERVEHLMRASYENVVGSSRFCQIERK